MKTNIQLIYNPMSGARLFPGKLDYFLEVFQDKGYEVTITRTRSASDFDNFFINKDLKNTKAIIVAGGDGTVNKIVNAMINNNIDLPLGVVPAGTANDFAVNLGIPANFAECFDVLSQMKTREVDIGRVNGKYFVNVCCGGLFTNVSQNIDIELKNTLGKLAYYIKGVQQLPKFKKLRLKIYNNDEKVSDDYYFLFLLLNGASAGSFTKVGKNAKIDDGYMNFIGIKECPFNYIPILLGKIIQGDHLNDKYITAFETKKMKIECMEGDEDFYESDIDGESGPRFPLKIDVLNKKIKVITG